MLLALLLISTSGGCSALTSDEFVLAITSLWHLTFYYPGSNRLGNLVPIIASSIHDPVLNMRVQYFIFASSGFLMLFLAAKYVLRNSSLLLLFGLLITLIFTQFEHLAILMLFISAQPYSLSLALLFASLLFLRRHMPGLHRQRGGILFVGFFLMLLAFWVNLSLIIIISFYALTFVLLDPRRELRRLRSYQRIFKSRQGSFWYYPSIAVSYLARCEGALLFAFAMIAFATNAIASRLYMDMFPELNRLSPETYAVFNPSVLNVVRMAGNLNSAFGARAFPFEILFVLAAVCFHHTLHWRARRRHKPLPMAPVRLRAALSLLLAALLSAAVIAQLDHVRINDFHFRYIIPSGLVIIVLLAAYGGALLRFLVKLALRAAGSTLFLTHNRIATGVPAGAGVVLVGVSVLAMVGRYGVPITTCTFDAPDGAAAKAALYALDHGYSGILGSYWDLWPVVFQAARISYERGQPPQIFPTGYRSEVFIDRIQSQIDSDIRFDGKYVLLCLYEGKNSEFGRINCTEWLERNDVWWGLPNQEDVQVTPVPAGPNARAVTITLPHLKPSETISLHAADHNQRFLAEGWYPPEEHGVWTSGSRATIAAVFERPSGQGIVVHIGIGAAMVSYDPKASPMHVQVLVNHAHIAEWVFEAGQPVTSRTLSIPGAILDESALTSITFEIDRPYTPRELGVNPDDVRRLGIALSNLQFEVAP